MDAGERPEGRWARARYRIYFDTPRKPLEPHRPLPWLVRALSWLLLAASFFTSAVAAVIAGAMTSRDVERELVAFSLLFLVLGLLVRWAAMPMRPTPVVLAPVDDED